MALAEVACHRLDADEVGLQLRHAQLRRNVQRLERIFADHAVCRKAVARLETLERTIDVRIERAGNTCFAWQVTRNHQPLAKRLDGRIADADLQTLLA